MVRFVGKQVNLLARSHCIAQLRASILERPRNDVKREGQDGENEEEACCSNGGEDHGLMLNPAWTFHNRLERLFKSVQCPMANRQFPRNSSLVTFRNSPRHVFSLLREVTLREVA